MIIPIYSQSFILDEDNGGDYFMSIVGAPQLGVTTVANSKLPMQDGTIKGFGVYVESGANTIGTDIEFSVFYNNSQLFTDNILVLQDGVIYNPLNVATSNNGQIYIKFIVPSSGGQCPINGCWIEFEPA